ncbi:response regulator transcription factor [Bradyrhizobium sp. Arg68]|uniref:response regulator transcription factor n=1 Tax=Bradyrhizobium ivorense TaxID=2511166 RepID=UPI001E41E80A|nr:response regulator transcription factor [Bradyrhizobium ivorense]MCC8938984.1 response regulator transcription factor [Bradyrhizobium ivorense]
MNQHAVDADRALVLVVDDDERVRLSIQELVESVGLDAACFGSAKELLESELCERPGCLILDVRLPGLSGLDFQRNLVSSGNMKPVVFLTGHGDIPMSVEAMKGGAVDFLTKPVRDQSLLDAITTGIARDLAQRAAARAVQQHIERFETLTGRERQMLREVSRGRVNKQIAFDLGISVVTVKLHRAKLMRKMHATSVGDLIRAWETLPTSVREQQVSPKTT